MLGVLCSKNLTFSPWVIYRWTSLDWDLKLNLLKRNLLFFPFAILCSAFIWLCQFIAYSLLPKVVCGLHFIIAAMLVCGACFCIPWFQRRAGWFSVGWHLCWFMCFIVWNIAACSNFIALHSWGSAIQFPMFWNFLMYDVGLRSQLIVFLYDKKTLYYAFSTIGCYIFLYCLIRHVWVNFFLKKWTPKQTQSLLHLSASGLVFMSIFIVAYRPVYFQQEPFTSFVFCWNTPVNQDGLDNYRKESLLADNTLRQQYNTGGVRPKKNIIIITLDSLRADHLSFYGYSRPTTPFLNELYQKKQLQKVDYAFSSCSESYCGIASC